MLEKESSGCMSTKTRVIIASLCSCVVAICFIGYSKQVQQNANKLRKDAMAKYGGEVVELVVATCPLEVGDTVDTSCVKPCDWIVDLAPVEAIDDIDAVLGKTITVPLAQGAPLTKLNFRDSDTELSVPSGYVLISVPVTPKLGVTANTVKDTHAVAYSAKDSGTCLLASNVRILAGATSEGIGANKTVSLAVLPDDVPKILEASNQGCLRLVLPADDVVSMAKQDDSKAPSQVDKEVDDDSDE